MTQSLLRFEVPENIALKRAGMAKAYDAASAEWKEKAESWITTSSAGTRFTSEDVVNACGLPTGGVKQNRNNAVGALLSKMARQGRIVDTGQWVKSKRKELHAAKVTVWEIAA